MADVFRSFQICVSLFVSGRCIFLAGFAILNSAPRSKALSLVRTLALCLSGRCDLPLAGIPGEIERSKSGLHLWIPSS